MKISDIDTPALLIDREIVLRNLQKMQNYADAAGVSLRPHTKTHKMPYFAKLQKSIGAAGITVAKTGEAEIMAANGLKDIFIANEIAGELKFQRIIALLRAGINLSFGIDSIEQASLIERAFERSGTKACVLAEIEVGENRSGFVEKQDFAAFIKFIKGCKKYRIPRRVLPRRPLLQSRR